MAGLENHGRNHTDTGDGHRIDNQLLSAVDWADKNIFNPFVNSLLLEPLSIIPNAVDFAGEKINEAARPIVHHDVLPHEILPKVTLLEVPEAKQWTPEWYAQQISSGLAMVVPFAGFGKVATITLRGFKLVQEAEEAGLLAGKILNVEKAGQVMGATAYLGLKTTSPGESHRAAAANGAASFSVYEAANALTAELPLPLKIPAMFLTAVIGNAAGQTASLCADDKDLPSAQHIAQWLESGCTKTPDDVRKFGQEITQNCVSAGVMNLLLPGTQHAIGEGLDMVGSMRTGTESGEKPSTNETNKAEETGSVSSGSEVRTEPVAEKAEETGSVSSGSDVKTEPVADKGDRDSQEQRDNHINRIIDKYRSRPISREQLNEIINAIPEKDRPLAKDFLTACSLNSSDAGLKAQFQAIKPRLAKVDWSDTEEGYEENDAEAYTLGPRSCGNLLGYLYRKFNDLPEVSLHDFDALESAARTGRAPDKAVIFGDTSKEPLAPEQNQILSQIKSVQLVDLHSFEKGLNITDFALGPEQVKNKLSALISEAEELRKEHPSATDQQLVNLVLDGPAEQHTKEIGPNASVVSPPAGLDELLLPKADSKTSQDPIERLYNLLVMPKSSEAEVQSFLSSFEGQDRDLVAQMLTTGSSYTSLESTFEALRKLDRKISAALSDYQIDPQSVVVPVDKDPGGSSHLLTYLYNKVGSAIPSENFKSALQVDKMLNSGGSEGKVLAYLDDGIYSGTQAVNVLNELNDHPSQFDRVLFCGLGGTPQGIQEIYKSLEKIDIDPNTFRSRRVSWQEAARSHKVLVRTAQILPSYNTDGNPLFRRLSDADRERVGTLGGSGGWGKLNLSQFWFWHFPDSDAPLFQRFARDVLKLAP